MRVLLVEDDRMIGEAIRDALRDAAFAVDWVRDGHSADTALCGPDHDLVLLDLGLPGADGLAVLERLRGRGSDIPVVIVTARDRLDERLRGLDGGADDYVLKPFAMSELLARIRAVLRRRGGSAAPTLGNQRLSLDPNTRAATLDRGPPITLSNREYALLDALLRRPGAICSRDELESRIYGWGEEVESNAVEYLIHSVRRKLGRDSIRNVRGVGWTVPHEP